MKHEDRTYRMYLEDMNLAMERIAEYIQGYSFAKFMQDYKTADAVIRNFEIIGEASKNLPKKFKDEHLEIPWSEMYLLRNKISHQYFGIDYEILWDVAVNHLPQNKKQIEVLLNTESPKK